MACQTREAPPPMPEGSFELRGKVAVADGETRFSARFVWQQVQEWFDVQLWGPLGQGRVRLTGDPRRLSIVDGRGDLVSAGSPEAVMREHLGWTLPLSALAHWARGLPSPGLPMTGAQRDAQGRLVAFEQLGWRVRYDAQAPGSDADERWLPRRITAERPGYRVRLVVSDWRI